MRKIREMNGRYFKIGDLVARKSERPIIHYCIIGFRYPEKGEKVAILKALFNNTAVVEVPLTDLHNLLVKGKL
ncbi:MAG: hypothetical protein GX295_04805 [Syntrophomonadaceae bacterium]|nr:hypothetical protein [Syntrophomonadaceae bacterium]